MVPSLQKFFFRPEQVLEKIEEEGSSDWCKSRMMITSTPVRRSDGSCKAESPSSGLEQPPTLPNLEGLSKLNIDTKAPELISPIAVAQTSPEVFRLETSFRASSPRPVSPVPTSNSGGHNLNDSDLLSFSRLANTCDTPSFFGSNDPEFKFEGAGETIFRTTVHAGNVGADSDVVDLDNPNELELFRAKATGFRLALF